MKELEVASPGEEVAFGLLRSSLSEVQKRLEEKKPAARWRKAVHGGEWFDREANLVHDHSSRAFATVIRRY